MRRHTTLKLLHMADLHIGKRLYEFNLIEDQKHILEQIVSIVKAENPDGVIIAGDVYDKSQPSAEAVELLDWFLTRLTELHTQVFMISGNHDSPERIGFGSQILNKNGLHIAGVFDGNVKKVIATLNINTEQRNILVSHQFVVRGTVTGSSQNNRCHR